ncbi:hypothetical protein A2963_02875 [Candidatus Roizmanbacteria bacterium RIFCSPLOWO2_01_FULL_40_13]|nr:MAG: hypothetical protein A2963_02875 [Candidatus Roizmanbacteria bacterium RIFCSPLOWO2_01_FULL_40_13]
MEKLPTVTIATIACNEEANIKKFLESVLDQKEKGFKISTILVISDGSTDHTVKIAKSFKSNLIRVTDHSERIGKSARLNEIYKNLDTDLLLQSDSDIIYSHRFVARDMILGLLEEPKIAMCGGNPLPVKGSTFTENAINLTTEAYQQFRKKVRGGNNVFSADGRILAFKKELVEKLRIPEDMIANDMFSYLCCLSLGYKYKFVPTAIVDYRSPQDVGDHIKQNVRFRASPLRMEKYFPKGLVSKETSIPIMLLYKTQFLIFLKHPISTLYIYLINLYCKLRARWTESKLNARWAVANSTKSV